MLKRKLQMLLLRYTVSYCGATVSFDTRRLFHSK